MTSYKKPGVAFWATVALVVVIVGYPLSFGPACWLCEHCILSQKATWIAYRPITWMACNGPVRFAAAIDDYVAIWGDNRRLIEIHERDQFLPSAWSTRPVRRADSVSPIDYEIEQSRRSNVAAVVLELRRL